MDQTRHREGLGEVGIGTGGQARGDVLEGCAGRQQQDADAVGGGVAAQGGADLEARRAGHRDVEGGEGRAPDAPGIDPSRTARSGRSARPAARAAVPSGASATTVQPALPTARQTSARMSSSSSATSTRTGELDGAGVAMGVRRTSSTAAPVGRAASGSSAAGASSSGTTAAPRAAWTALDRGVTPTEEAVAPI